LTDECFVKQIRRLKGKSAEEILAMVKNGDNFAFVAKAGDLVRLPLNYVYIMYRPSHAEAFRWSVCSGVADLPGVFKSTMQLMSAYPSLKDTPYKTWSIVLGQFVANLT
jgi:hypothetical protein